jgi:hypothetical protein
LLCLWSACAVNRSSVTLLAILSKWESVFIAYRWRLATHWFTYSKGKGTLTDPKAKSGGKGISQLFLDLTARKGVGGQHHAPAAFTPVKDSVPIVQEAG